MNTPVSIKELNDARFIDQQIPIFISWKTVGASDAHLRSSHFIERKTSSETWITLNFVKRSIFWVLLWVSNDWIVAVDTTTELDRLHGMKVSSYIHISDILDIHR